MKRAAILLGIAVWCSTTLGVVLAEVDADRAEKPNVIVIIIDD